MSCLLCFTVGLGSLGFTLLLGTFLFTFIGNGSCLTIIISSLNVSLISHAFMSSLLYTFSLFMRIVALLSLLTSLSSCSFSIYLVTIIHVFLFIFDTITIFSFVVLTFPLTFLSSLVNPYLIYQALYYCRNAFASFQAFTLTIVFLIVLFLTNFIYF